MCFKQKYSIQKRMQESVRITQKFPDRIPIICEKSINSRDNLPQIDKIKYLVPNDLNVAQFIQIIRNRLRLTQHDAIYLIVGDIIPGPMTAMAELYYHHIDADGFLYISYAAENTFGKKSLLRWLQD